MRPGFGILSSQVAFHAQLLSQPFLSVSFAGLFPLAIDLFNFRLHLEPLKPSLQLFELPPSDSGSVTMSETLQAPPFTNLQLVERVDR